MIFLAENKGASTTVSGYGSKLDKIIQNQDKTTNTLKETSKFDQILKNQEKIQKKNQEKKILTNQEKMLRHQSQEILDHVSFYWNRFLEASKNGFNEMESFFQTNFPEYMNKVSGYTKNLPTRKQISKRFESDLMKPSREFLQKASVPKEYENYIIYPIFGIVAILLLVLTYFVMEYLICKPIGWVSAFICCKRQKNKTKKNYKH